MTTPPYRFRRPGIGILAAQRWRSFGRHEFLLLILLTAFIALGSNLSPYFLTPSNFSDVSGGLIVVGLMALPLSYLIICGEIDLSVESTLGLSSAVLGYLWTRNVPLAFGIPAVLVMGAAAGLLNGLLVTWARLPSLVVTLGTLALYRGLAFVVLGQSGVTNFPDNFTEFGFSDIPGTVVPWTLPIFVVLATGFGFVLHSTWIGRQIFAAGRNSEAARFAGVRVAQLKTMLFVLSGIVSALAGVVLTAHLSTARADAGQGLVLQVVTVVLLGGVSIFGGEGTILGVVLGYSVLAVLSNALILANVSADVQTIVVGALLVLSVVTPTVFNWIRQVVRLRGVVQPVTH